MTAILSKLSLRYDSWKADQQNWACIDDFLSEAARGMRSGLHTISAEELPLDVLAINMETLSARQQKVLPVFFSAAVGSRAGKPGPFFSGLGLARAGRYAALCVADPSLALSQTLSLAWYAGSTRQRTQATLEKLLRGVADRWGVELLLIGGSGGGYAALYFGSRLGQRASTLVWNPQTDILNYYQSAVQQYLNACAEERGRVSRATASSRLRELGIEHQVIQQYSRGAYPKRVIYLQNSADRFHVDNHALPLLAHLPLKAAGARCYVDQSEVFLTCFLHWGEGHASVPKEELKWLIARLMDPKASSQMIQAELLAAPGLFGGPPANAPFSLRAWGSLVQLEAHASVSGSNLVVRAELVGMPEGVELPEYAFYVFSGKEKVYMEWYGAAKEIVVPLDRVRRATSITAFARDSFGGKVSASAPVDPSGGFT